MNGRTCRLQRRYSSDSSSDTGEGVSEQVGGDLTVINIATGGGARGTSGVGPFTRWQGPVNTDTCSLGVQQSQERGTSKVLQSPSSAWGFFQKPLSSENYYTPYLQVTVSKRPPVRFSLNDFFVSSLSATVALQARPGALLQPVQFAAVSVFYCCSQCLVLLQSLSMLGAPTPKAPTSELGLYLSVCPRSLDVHV